MKRHEQFTVMGVPFFPVGGQAHNSTSYVLDDLKISFDAVKKLNGNSCAVTICWDRFEPEEGCFDRAYITDMIDLAREMGVHLVFLWFGTWKNGIMSYCPAWVKKDTARFERARSADGTPMLNLTCHVRANVEADAKAFREFVKTVRDHDKDTGTVLGFQIENESGQWLGARRDFHPKATEAFMSNVPGELLDYLDKNRDGEPYKRWQKAGGKKSGSWPEVFGRFGAEAFSAWTVARYIDEVAAAGREEYDIFMYVNVALDGLTKGEDFEIPGLSYFAGGPVPKVRDIWYAALDHVDAVCPDDYKMETNRHREVLEAYANPERGWPLYVPESGLEAVNTTHMIYAAAELGAIGYHIFGVESCLAKDGELKPEAEAAARSFMILKSIAPLLIRFRGKDNVRAVYQYTGETSMLLELENWKCYASFVGLKSYLWGNVGADFRHPEMSDGRFGDPMDYRAEKGRAVLVQTGPDEFYAAGQGCHLFFNEYEPVDGSIPANLLNPTIQVTTTDYIEVTEGHFDENGEYIVDRVRSGDESWRGVWLAADCGVVRFTLKRADR
jgi:hypothetical protein